MFPPSRLAVPATLLMLTLAPAAAAADSHTQELVGFVIYTDGKRPVGFGSGVVVCFTRGSQRAEVTTNGIGWYRIHLEPGEWTIASIKRGKRRMRLARFQRRTLPVESWHTPLRADIFAREP